MNHLTLYTPSYGSTDVVVLLMPPAHKALHKAGKAWDKISDSRFGEAQKRKIAAGTLTFAESSWYESSVVARCLHAGSEDILQQIEKLCDVRLCNCSLNSLPLNTSEKIVMAQLLQLGFGPKPTLVGQLFARLLWEKAQEARKALEI